MTLSRYGVSPSSSLQAAVHHATSSNLAKNQILCYNQLSANELLSGNDDDVGKHERAGRSQSPISPKRVSSRLGILWTIFVLSVLICSGYFFRDYIQMLLACVENQNDLIVFPILILLYMLVSLPFAWGYLIINIATGYMYGFWSCLLYTSPSPRD